MAQSVIGALRVNLGMDSAKFQSGAKKVNDPLKVMKGRFLAMSAAAVAFGAAITASALKSAQEIDRVAKAARRLDSSITGFRALELAADEAGVPLSGLTNDVQNMNREIANIGVAGNADRALKKLGLSAADLAGSDADEKIATIADRIKGLGLNSGQATTILRDLGVRNREMVLLMLQGGDALRSARKDVIDYGLALSGVDAGAIEQANDRISRLGLIGQYAGQKLAVALVPALGAMAKGMTDSLREGGLLRAVIDAITDNILRLGTYVATAATAFGVVYVGALVSARVATLSFAGSLVVLRTALIRTGIGAVVVLVGELIFRLAGVVSAAGGVGAAFGFLKNLAVEVWQRIGDGADYVRAAMAVMTSKMSANFYAGLRALAGAWVEFTWTVADGMNAIFNTNIQGASAKVTQELGAAQLEAEAFGSAAEASMIRAKDGFAAPLTSIEALRAAMKSAGEETATTTEIVGGLNEELDGGKGGGAGKALDALEKKAKSASDAIRGSFTDAFKGVMSGATSLGEGVAGIFSKIADMLLDSVGNQLFEGISGAIGSVITSGIPGFANGTDDAPGGMAWVGEQGRELVNLRPGSQVVPNHKLGGGGNSSVSINVDVTGARGNAEIQEMVSSGVSAGLRQYDSQVLPKRVNQISTDPRGIG
ncbi:hypothetical protein [Falsihalocynthiibacter arcticus]|uniref:hypothetical protein n=1 Tax=Falsihalocynthiibacter arcticus TaxID=1579316 RepID=UPI003002363C